MTRSARSTRCSRSRRPGRASTTPGHRLVRADRARLGARAGLTRTESDSGATQVDATLDYPATGTLSPGVTYTWTGSLTVPADDTYYLWLQAATRRAAVAPARRPHRSRWTGPRRRRSPRPCCRAPIRRRSSRRAAEHRRDRPAGAGTHTITITTAPPATARRRSSSGFAWSRLSTTIADATAAARSAKVAVVFVDDNGAANADIVNSLARNEDALVAAVAAANPRTVVVASTGDPVLTPWLGA